MKYLLLLCSLFLVTVQASDLGKEQRWADQTVDSILDGEAVWLKTDKLKFLSIYTEAEEESELGMIVVHGTGIHPNWDQVVKPVRVEMTTYGWNTLSIQMPILHNEATYDDYVPLYPEVPARLKAAEDYLLAQGIKKIVIVAHSQGSTMSAYYLANNDHNVSAFVAIGMQATQKDVDINAATSLQSITIPVLDLYGSDDLPGVLQTVGAKKQAAGHNKKYQQQLIQGAEHFFDDKNDELIEAITRWLEKL
ncbi:MAG: alpha/beta fold hydrolase [Gammaproteobacteria bacterium]|nr:alpha/beta fold hydrolase [Gammaproteobacteria bacterium]